MRRTTMAMVLCGLLLTAGCGDTGATADLDPLDDLDGRTFLSQSVDDPQHRLVPGTTIRLTFTDGDLRAHADCNHLAGSVRIDGRRLVVDNLSTTEMACDRALMDQDGWLAAFLMARPRVERAGAELVIDNGTTRIRLVDESAVREHEPLEGTTWQVETVLRGAGDDGTASSVPIGAGASLHLEGGRVTVHTGCNTGEGAVRVEPHTLAVTRLTITKRGCSGAVADLERAVLVVLEPPTSYTIEYDALTLIAAGGEHGLVLRAGNG